MKWAFPIEKICAFEEMMRVYRRKFWGFVLAALLLSPKYGVLARLLRRRHLHEQSLARWRKN